MKYCSRCGSELSYRVPEGDDRSRFICDSCGIVHYENPKMVVGCIPEIDDQVLFCRRSILPQYGKWTIPAGYLEKGETVEAGAKRETFEEAGARIKSIKPYGLYNLTFISQVYLIFRGRLVDGNFGAGDESLEVRLFREEEVPWADLAFPVIRETLKFYFRDRLNGVFPFHIAEIKSVSQTG
ncbi:MAG: NUDIX hydrolase [Deltaproteobacteria bacterium]|nr:NUDIX hydrolase [Deltaproteobacteria bacterium]